MSARICTVLHLPLHAAVTHDLNEGGNLIGPQTMWEFQEIGLEAALLALSARGIASDVDVIGKKHE